LLAYDCACTLFVVVYVTSGVTKFVGRLDQSLALGGKARRFQEDEPRMDEEFRTYIAPVRAY